MTIEPAKAARKAGDLAPDPPREPLPGQAAFGFLDALETHTS